MTVKSKPGCLKPWRLNRPMITRGVHHQDNRKLGRDKERTINVWRNNPTTHNGGPLTALIDNLQMQYFPQSLEALERYLQDDGALILKGSTPQLHLKPSILTHEMHTLPRIDACKQTIRGVKDNKGGIEYLQITEGDIQVDNLEAIEQIRKKIYARSVLLDFRSHGINKRGTISYETFISKLGQEDSEEPDEAEALMTKSHRNEPRLWGYWNLPQYSLRDIPGNLLTEANGGTVQGLDEEMVANNDIYNIITLRKSIHGADTCFHLVSGEAVTWTLVKGRHKAELENYVSSISHVTDRRCDAWVEHQKIHVPPTKLIDAGLDIFVFEQAPGTTVLVHRDSYFQAYSTGPNMLTSMHYLSYRKLTKISYITQVSPCRYVLGCDHESAFSSLKLERPYIKRGNTVKFTVVHQRPDSPVL